MQQLSALDALALIDFGSREEFEIPDDAVVTDAIVVFRYQTPEAHAPGTAWGTSYCDNFARDGVMRSVLNRMEQETLAGWTAE